MTSTDGRVVFVGVASLDAIALVGQFPEPDQRIVADEVRFAGGGPAATAAVAAARLGVAASFVGAVGRDADGERIVAELAAEGVDVGGVVYADEQPSGASVVVVDHSRGTRAICNRPAPDLELEVGVAGDVVRNADWVHVDQAGWAPVRRLLADAPAGSQPRISVDAGNPIPGLEPRGIDLLVPTYAALRALYADAEGDDPLASALKDGARTVVATCGADGAVAMSDDGRRAQVPGYATQMVSTLGAGDVFHGALLAAIVRGYDLAQQLAYANTAAALSCRGLDGRSAIPSHRDVTEFLSAPPA
jgi:sulfofructose kinase